MTTTPTSTVPDTKPSLRRASGDSHRSRYRGLGIALRSRSAVRGVSVLVACLVFVLAALLVAGPSLFARLTTAELSHTLDNVPPHDRYLAARTSESLAVGTSTLGDRGASRGLSPDEDQLYGTFLDQLDTLAAQFPQPLASVVGPPLWTITAPGAFFQGGTAGLSTTDPSGANVVVQTVTDLRASAVANLIAGSWPDPTAQGPDEPAEIVVSEQTVERLGISLGQILGPYQVSGIFQPKDPEADYWALNPGMLQASLYDDGNNPPVLTATVFIDTVNLSPLESEGRLTQVWFPLDLSRLDGGNAALVLAQIRGVVAKKYNLPSGPPSEQPDGSMQSLTLTAGLIPALAAALDRIDSARSVLIVAAVGPLGAVVAVVALGLSALAQRRRPTIAALATRGGSARQIRSLLAIDGLVTGLTPAAAAIVVGWLVFRGDLSVIGIVLAVVAGLIPAGYLACTPIGRAVQRSRPDSGVRARHRFRWVAELAVLAVAGVSVYLLFSAGLQAESAASASAGSSGPGSTVATGSSGAGVDVLVAAAPLLLAAAACVLVFRLYPLPLRLLAARYRRSRSAVGFLGSLRALRDPSVGVAPVLAVVVGVSVAVFSAVTVSTLSTGIRAAAVSSVGADLRADTPAVVGITNDDLAAIDKLPGVAAAARIQWLRSTSVRIPDRVNPVTADVYLADLQALATVQHTVVDAVPIPPGMAGATPPAVLVSSDIAGYLAATGATIGPMDSSGPNGNISVDRTSVQVVGSADRLTGLGYSTTWVLGDASAGTLSKLGVFRPSTVLVSLTPGADPTAVAREITSVLGPDSSISMPSEVVDTANANPIVAGLRTALIAALAVAALAAAAAVLLTMLLGSGTRTRLLAILRVLGMSVRQRRRLVVWEQAPTVAVALVVGAGLGVALTAIVRAVIDLRPFTTGNVQPAFTVSGALLTALLGGFVVLVAVAVGVALVMTRRTGVAAVVRVDEE